VQQVRVHDLRHTFGQRPRDAGVSEEDRALLLGHSTTSMPRGSNGSNAGCSSQQGERDAGPDDAVANRRWL